MVVIKLATLLLASATLLNASPCPYGKLYEEGKLSDSEAAQFLAARSDKEAAVEHMMSEVQKRDLEHAKQEKVYKRQLLSGLLPLGGGLLGGVLQPFSGVLAGLDVPTPQETGEVLIPDSEHPFQWPETTDVRGMCPTLNTMANHGYIARDGITNFAEAANACQITLGFGYDTCTFLSALGLLAGGDLATGKYSIGGADSRVPNTLGPALGISHHGPFEIDQSISRSDTYFGNNADFNLTRFDRLAAIAEGNGGQFGVETFNQERQITYTESRDTNPEFDAGAKHLAVSLAERVFIYRALPNGTDETNANFANIAPFYLNETFPPFWFRRGTPYTLPNVADDIVALYALGPTELGSNQGLNNFVPLGTDFGALTPAEVMCFLEVNMLDIVPGQFSTEITGELSVVESFVNGAISPFFASSDCTLDWTKAGESAGTTVEGTSATSPVLVDGVYLQEAPAYSQIP